jgi:hypothetical protein
MLKNKYELASKPERDRIIGNSFIGSYGPFPVHNVKFNKLVQYLEKVNNNLQVPEESEYQTALKDTIKMQLNLARLKILNDYALKEKKEGGFGSDVLSALSFRNWCGISSPIYDNIKNDLDDPNKMFAIDRICLRHDVSYTKSKTQEEMNEADNTMIKEIFNEYVINFNRNFVTGDYQSDFTTWTSSFKTVFNYLMTTLETGFVGKITYDAAKTAYNVLKLPYDYIVASNPLPDYEVGYFKGMSKMVSELGDIESQGDPYTKGVVDMFKDAFMKRPEREMPQKLQMLKMRLKSNLGPIAFTFVATTLLKDRLLALGSLAAMTLKKGFETLTGYKVADLTKHDVSDEDLENMIKVFETLQNQYLEQSNLDPIKIGNEWTKENIEIPPIEILNKDINIIVEQNKAYNELNQTLIERQTPETVLESSNEPFFSEEELKRLKEYEELNEHFDKIFSETNLVPYPDLPSTEPIVDIANKKDEILDINKEKDTTAEASASRTSGDAPTSSIYSETIEQNEDVYRNQNDENDKMEL